MDSLSEQLDQAELETIPISKNQLKRQKKHERWLEGRIERRTHEREKRKLKRKALAKEREEKGEAFVNPKRYNLMETSKNKFRIVIDLDFEDYMTQNEISKSVQQVARIYAANRHSDNPSQLYLTSLKDKDYVELFNEPMLNEIENKEQFIYLTADTDDTLPSVDEILDKYESKIFIIGGLVDHNRHKKLCFDRAQQHGIRTAKLPITDHVKLNQRQILSTVTVFEILLEAFSSHKPWSEILVSKIPKRKIAQPDNDADTADGIE